MKLLRQSTPTTVQIGPLVASSGGALVTNAALTTGLLELYQAGAASAIDISGRNWVHISNGVYRLDLTAGDLSVAGPLQIHAHPASVVPFLSLANVLSPGAYDALCGGAPMPSNVQSINGNTSSAVNMALAAAGILSVTIQNGASTNNIPTNLTQAVSGFFTGRTLVFITGALAGQATSIVGYNGATKVLQTNNLTAAPSPSDTAVIV